VKILYLNPTGELGGAERSLLLLMQSLRAARPEWCLGLIAGGGGPLVERAKALGADATALPFPAGLAQLGDSGVGETVGGRSMVRMAAELGRAGLPGLDYLRRLRRAIAEFAPDAVHSNGFKMHALGAWARTSLCPLIWHVRDYVSARPMMSRLMRANARRCSVAIANSASVADDLRAVCGPALPIRVAYNAVDLARFAPNGPASNLDELCAIPPAPKGALRIGLVATMARWKGHGVFLRAIRTAAERFPLRAYIIGGPIYARAVSQYRIEELRAMAAELGLASAVGFTGFVDDVPAALRALDVVVHASVEPEPFGLAIAEAMACGKPVVASAAGGAAEIVSPGVDALVHRPGDSAELAERLIQLVREPELRSALGIAARVSAERRFSVSRLVGEVTPIYEGLARAAA
jgi:glycosyltransferase involved in cell wall biosynthesis